MLVGFILFDQGVRIDWIIPIGQSSFYASNVFAIGHLSRGTIAATRTVVGATHAWLAGKAENGIVVLEFETPRPPMQCQIFVRREQRGRTLDWFSERLMEAGGVRRQPTQSS